MITNLKVNADTRFMPQFDRLLVKPCAFEKSSTFHLVELSENAPDKGIVELVGPHVTQFKPGDVVLFGKYCGIPADEDRHFVREEDIIAIIEGAEVIEKKEFDVLGAPRVVGV